MSGERIICPVRGRSILLTPEEEVRQAVINYLIEKRDYPRGLMSVENTILVNGRKKRTDILIHDEHGKGLMIIECKAPDIPITEKTVAQIATYNAALKVKYLYLTNGIENHIFEVDGEQKRLQRLDEVPTYDQL